MRNDPRRPCHCSVSLFFQRFDRIFYDRHCLVTFFLCYNKRRDHTDDVCSDCCDQKFSVETAMFYIYTADRIIKFHTNQKSLMSYFFYMRKFFQF